MNIIPNHLMAFRLQNIIDSNLFASDDNASRQARELLEKLPRVPVDGHDMYTAGAGEVDQAYVGTVSKTQSGQWRYEIETPEGPYCGGAGFDSEEEAASEMCDMLADLNNG